jgi:hypothetical protein
LSAARKLSLVSFAALVCGAAQALALPPVMVELGYGDQVATSRTFDLVSTQDNLSGLQLSLATRPYAPWGRVWVEVSEFYGGTSGDLHGDGVAVLSFHELGASAIYRHELIGPFGWYAKLGPRVALGQLNIQDESGNNQLGQWNATVGAGGAAGLEGSILFTGREGEASGAIGVRLEVGYVWFPDLSYNSLQAPKSTPVAGQQPIASADVAMGSLNLSGVHWGLTSFAKF